MVNSVYNYYLNNYAVKPASKSDTHKKSELRSIYNNIIKISKKSPLYKIDLSDDLQRYIIDLKENAREIKNVTDSISFGDSLQYNKKLISTNDDVLTVNYLGNDTDSDTSTSYDFEVLKLASPQINTGVLKRSDTTDLKVGDHKFEVSIDDSTYEFQFSVKNEDNDLSIQQKLSRLINNSNIGLQSTVIINGNKSAIKISSTSTGATFSGNIFSIENSEDDKNNMISDYFGLNNMTTSPANAEFRINGMDKTSAANTFTINKEYEITFHSADETNNIASLKYKDDTDAFIDSAKELISTFNSMINLGEKQGTISGDSSSLIKDIQKTYLPYKNDLEAVGIYADDSGFLSLDESLAISATDEDSFSESLNKLYNFNASLSKCAGDISIDPMKYINKIMISYPNPTHSFANPYMTSIYSGLMYNGYI